jgi:hypothetical protein
MITFQGDWRASPPLSPHPLLAHHVNKTVYAVTDVYVFLPGHVEARVIILGIPLLCGQLPGFGLVWIDGEYRSRRRLPRQIMVKEGESVGVWRVLDEGGGACCK